MRKPASLHPEALARASAQPPTSPTPAPTPAPMSRSPAAPSTDVEWTISVVTAPARNRFTNGVAMPSLSPLSTLSRRRIRLGIRASSMMAGPEGRIGGGHDGSDGGRHPQRDARDEAEGHRRPEADGQGQPDGQEPDGQAEVVTELVDVDPRGVGEEDQRQGDLGQRPDGRRVGIEVDEGQGSVGDDQAHDHKGDGGA